MALLKPKGKVHNARCYFFFFGFNTPTAAIAGALSQMYLVQTSLIVLASIACGVEEKKNKIYIYINGLLSLQVKLTEQ